MHQELCEIAPSWSLEIFRVSNRRRQRRAVQALERLSLPHVQVLAVQRGNDCFVMVDVISIADLIPVRRVIVRADATASHVHSAGPRHDDAYGALSSVVTV